MVVSYLGHCLLPKIPNLEIKLIETQRILRRDGHFASGYLRWHCDCTADLFE